MKILKSKKFWAIFVVSIFAIYTLCGFFLVPYILTDILPQKLKEQNIYAKIQSAKFNPFTYELNLENASLVTKDNAPVFKVKSFTTKLAISRLFTKEIKLENLLFSSPELSTIIDENGKLNLLKIGNFQDDNSTKKPQTQKENGWNVVVDLLDIDNAKINFKDNRKNRKFDFSLNDLNYQAKNLSTKRGDVSPQKLNTKSSSAKSVDINGNLSLNPFNTQGDIKVEDLKLSNLYNYSVADKNIYPKKASADIKFSYKTELSDSGLSVELSKIDILLKDVQLYTNETLFAKLNSLDIANFDVNVMLGKKQKTVKVKGDKIELVAPNIYNSKLTPLKLQSKKIAILKPTVGIVLEKNLEAKISDINVNGLKLNLENNTSANLKSLALKNIDATTTLDKNATTKLNLENLTLNEVDFSDSSTLPLKGALAKLSVDKTVLNFPSSKKLLSIKSVGLSGVDIKNTNLKSSSFKAKNLNLNQLGLSSKNIDIKSVILDSLDTNIALLKSGDIDFLTGLKQSGESNTSKEPFGYNIEKVSVKNSSVLFKDEKKSFSQKISSIELNVDNITDDKTSLMRFSANAKEKKELALNSKGNIKLEPLEITSDIDLKYANLENFQPYIDEFVNAKLKKGSLDAKGKIELKKSLQVKLDTSLKNVKINSHSKTLASWRSLKIKKIDYKDDRLKIQNISLSNPKTQLIIAKNGDNNFKNILKSTDNKKSKKTSSKPFRYSIDSFNLANGSFALINNKLNKKSTTTISKIKTDIYKISSNKKVRSKAKLTAVINKTGYITTDANMYFGDMKKNTVIITALKGLKLTSLNPYATQYLGYNIDKGRLTLNLKEDIKKGQLKGDSLINLDQIELGDTVKSKDALALPLDTALMILKDSNGDVQLDVPISGDTNDPQFSYASTVITAFTNIITGIVTAPFSLIGNILGIDTKKLKTVDFEPSSNHLMPSEEEKMKAYVSILDKKPKLKLTISGAYDDKVDFNFDDNITIEKPSYKELAATRADVIKNALIKAGAPEDKIVLKKVAPTTANQGHWVGCKVGLE